MIKERSEAFPAAGEKEGGRPWLAALFPELTRRGAHPVREWLLYAVVFGIALLFARTHLAFGMYPFALAYLAAARHRVMPIFLGAFLGAFGLGAIGGIFATATALLLLLRTVFSLPVRRRAILPTTEALFSEGIGLRVAAAGLSGAGLAAYELFVSGAEDYALRFAAAAILAPLVLTLLYAWALEGEAALSFLLLKGEESVCGGGVELSLLALCVSLAFCLTPLSLFGLSLSTLFTAGIALLTARRQGAAWGGAVGLLCGLLGGAANGAAFALLGLLAGLLLPLGGSIGLLCGMAGAVGFSVYTGGLSGFLSVAPETAVAVLLLLPLLRGASGARGTESAERRLQRLALCASVADEGAGKGAGTAGLGEALSSLSALFHRLSGEEKRPSVSEYLGECQRVCARYCTTCSNRVACWERGERPAERTVFALSARLHDCGRITREDLPCAALDGCPRIDAILDEIREECAAMALSRHKGDRYEFLSLYASMLAKLLKDAEDGDRREAEEDREGMRLLGEALGKERALAFSVKGTREKRVAIGAGTGEELLARKEELHTISEHSLGVRLTSPVLRQREGGCALLMRSTHRYRVAAASASLPLVGSGDRLRHFTSPDGFFYGILSDGMGKGEEAAAVAEVSVEFLEAMLKGGCSRRSSVYMLNSLVRGRQSECSATVDMLILDLFEGHAAFLKSGAAPSYIRRGSEVLRVASRTMPLGMRSVPDAELLHVEIAPQDIVILLSDGLFTEDEEPAWLFRLLVSEDTGDLAALAERIVAEATARILEPRDDITVGLFRIEEAEREEETEL